MFTVRVTKKKSDSKKRQETEKKHPKYSHRDGNRLILKTTMFKTASQTFSPAEMPPLPSPQQQNIYTCRMIASPLITWRLPRQKKAPLIASPALFAHKQGFVGGIRKTVLPYTWAHT